MELETAAGQCLLLLPSSLALWVWVSAMLVLFMGGSQYRRTLCGLEFYVGRRLCGSLFSAHTTGRMSPTTVQHDQASSQYYSAVCITPPGRAVCSMSFVDGQLLGMQ